MSVRIQGAEHPLKDIFSDSFVFEIPPYQRPYSWTTEHAGELYEDLVSAMDADRSVAPDPYFLGSIVLAKEEHDPRAEVIDGQQRLTTLTILLAALAELDDGEEKRELEAFIQQKGSKFKQTKTVYRLTLRQRDASFFQKYVQSGRLRELVALDPDQLTDPRSNFRSNAALFLERLEELEADDRARLGMYLLNECYLVAVSTPDNESAFKIFAVLNDRGLDLSHADIIKSELIGKIDDTQEQTEYTEIWETAEEDLGVEAFADLFAHVRMIYSKAKARESVVKEFRSHVMPRIDDPRDFIDDVLAPYSGIYARILARAWFDYDESPDIERFLGWLARIDNVDWVPPAMSFLHEHGQEPCLIRRYLAALERLAASMFVRRVNVNGRIDRYARVLKEIELGHDLFANGSPLHLTEDEKTATIRHLDGDLYLERRIRSYVLLRLDEVASGGGAKYDQRITTVEHVLPQNPPDGSEWTEWFTPTERERWVHRLANLVLLPRRRNSAARNFDFGTKKEKYFSDEHRTSPFAITSQVIATVEWTVDVLERRQNVLLDRLIEAWDLRTLEAASKRQPGDGSAIVER